MKLLIDFLPIFIFFAIFKFYGIYVATGMAIVSSLLQVAFYRIKYKRFESLQLITFFLILLFGGATLVLHNEIFIKWKPTILYWLLALLFLGTSFFGKKTLIQHLLEKNIQLPQSVWQRLNMSWFLFLSLLGGANLFVVYHFSTNTWVNFKVFGALVLILIFSVLQTLYMSKYVDLKAEQNK